MRVPIVFSSLNLALLLVTSTPAAAANEKYLSHAPMRPLPTARNTPLAAGPKLFVDAAAGNDANAGTLKAPWKSLAHAVRHLKPGDTLYLRGGTYYEKVRLTRSGTADAPITIASYPGELVIVDGGLREFFESPETSWEPAKGGAAGEFVSVRSYHHADARAIPRQFVPAAWEPMWGIEDERPLALGHFADSMVPLHGYRNLADLRSANEYNLGDRKKTKEVGIYCGPGLWFNRDTGRIHVRLAHTAMAGLGDRAYRGETDPRKLRLVVAAGFGDAVLRANGVRHVRLEGLVFRGATGSPMIEVYGSEDIHLDHVTVFGGFPALLVNASKNVRVTHCVFRGNAAPWSGRSHMKYFGTASYQIILQNDQPLNENIEFAFCEFTDDHDCAYLRFAKNLQFHHNFVDNFNDDGLECGPKLRSHSMFIYQNRIGSCLGVFQQHEIDKDESPAVHDPKSGAYIFRNVIDQREGVYYHLPSEPDPSGAFLHYGGRLLGDHGSPIYPVMRVYHNTILQRTAGFRDMFLFGMVGALRNTERDVFNNILVQSEKAPGVAILGKEAGALREGGNLLWSMKEGAGPTANPFAKFRAGPLFKESQKFFAPGWTTLDRAADPKFVNWQNDASQAGDLRLQEDSPALDSGESLPPDWPDPLRESDKGRPDIGALPRSVRSWGVGMDGRIPLFGSSPTSN
jgi:hypothetical protein